jgi:Family of unknown function (DUF5994)
MRSRPGTVGRLNIPDHPPYWWRPAQHAALLAREDERRNVMPEPVGPRYEGIRPMADRPRMIPYGNATTVNTSPRAAAGAPSAIPTGFPSARVSFDSALIRHGATDGGWWPRSRNARAELPALIAALDARPGVRVSGWPSTALLVVPVPPGEDRLGRHEHSGHQSGHPTDRGHPYRRRRPGPVSGSRKPGAGFRPGGGVTLDLMRNTCLIDCRCLV